MGNIASINFKPTKNPIQEKHSDRCVAPSHVLKSGVTSSASALVEFTLILAVCASKFRVFCALTCAVPHSTSTLFCALSVAFHIQ
ncbi:hypothetical protein [Helicobacter sp. NHP22-001]|uniref:hypothetical protein n=1 Tax=Helicobacter sp. NHP22-001 TaxID=3040202 RepID=UPI002552E695|nr:hypothetical protein [Helicobacter sp. NHP22-001]